VTDPAAPSLATPEAPEAAALADTPAAPAPPPAAESAPVEDTRLLDSQRWCLLNHLLEAVPEHKLSLGEANKKLTGTLQKDLQLTPQAANRLREQLAQEGHIRITKTGRNVAYELTDAGREYLQTLEPYPPEDAVAAVSEEVRRYQTAYLLFQLFRAEDWTLGKGLANRSLGPTDLELTKSAAKQLRRQLAEQGALTIIPARGSESYRLTPHGEELLATLRHYPTTQFTLKGRQLNAILDRAQPAAPPPPKAAPEPTFAAPPADLSRAVYEEFEELRRERYGHTGLVPIYEIREKVAGKYGAQTARHDALDEPIRDLWRQGRVRLVALADLQKATPEQLNDSVPGVNETLFYMELAHEQPVAGKPI
jgi:DNA-binding MarR family transcriptional regulator